MDLSKHNLSGVAKTYPHPMGILVPRLSVSFSAWGIPKLGTGIRLLSAVHTNTSNLRTNILDFRGLDSSIILILGAEIIMSRDFPGRDHLREIGRSLPPSRP